MKQRHFPGSEGGHVATHVRQYVIAHGDAVHRATGLFLSPHYGASKLRWALDHLAAVRAAHDDFVKRLAAIQGLMDKVRALFDRMAFAV